MSKSSTAAQYSVWCSYSIYLHCYTHTHTSMASGCKVKERSLEGLGLHFFPVMKMDAGIFPFLTSCCFCVVFTIDFTPVLFLFSPSWNRAVWLHYSLGLCLFWHFLLQLLCRCYGWAGLDDCSEKWNTIWSLLWVVYLKKKRSNLPVSDVASGKHFWWKLLKKPEWSTELNFLNSKITKIDSEITENICYIKCY